MLRKKIFLLGFLGLVCFGYLVFWASPGDAFFQGEVGNFCQEDILSLVFDFDKLGKIVLSSQLMEGEKFNLSAKLDHFKLANIDFFANFFTRGELSYKKDNQSAFVQGKIFVRDLLLNSKPVYDLDIFYEILGSLASESDCVIRVPYLRWGSCFGHGEIQIKHDPSFKLFLTIDQVSVSELNVLFDLKKLAVICPLFDDCQSGVISAQIQMEGLLRSPRISARFEIDYMDSFAKNRRAVINLRGVYPVVTIDDSFIREGQDIIFSIRGNLELDKISLSGPQDSLEYFMRPQDRDSVVITTDGSAHSRIRFTKKGVAGFDAGPAAQNRSVSFEGQKEMLELEHDLKSDRRAFKMRVAGDEERISWEHKVRF
ncbi:MAG: hypothetical protein ABIC68_01430 [Candidatus Omnitrophota bacterium]